MSAHNKALAIRWIEDCWNARQERTIADLLAPDGVGYLEGGLTIKGPAEFDAFRREYIAAFPDVSVKIEEILADGDVVALRWRATGIHQGRIGECDPSGKCVEVVGSTWLRFRDGKIVEGRDTWNQGAFMASLRAA